MVLGASHWVYIAVMAAIVLAMALRRGVIILSIVGIAALGALSPNARPGFEDHLIFAVQAVFKAMLLSGTQLFDIVLLIALMLAMLRSLQAQCVDEIMIAPLRKLMVGPRSAFLVLAGAMYMASIFFWPSPATALIGAVLVPVAARVGLPAVAATIAINIAGHGMALSADPVIQGATRITAGAAGLQTPDILSYTVLFSTLCGAVALLLSGIMLRRDMRRGSLTEMEVGAPVRLALGAPDGTPNGFSRALAVLVPVVLLGVGGIMVWRAIMTPDKAIYGADATALLGGTAVGLLILASFAHEGHRAFEGIVEHLTEGFLFAIRIFAPVIPIVAFFLLGDPQHAPTVLGDGTPGFLLDIGRVVGSNIGEDAVLLVLGVMMIGVLAGIDGSGFSGLPLVGAMSGALAGHSPATVAVLASAGQIASIWVGGGTVIPWSGVCAVAGIAGTDPVEVARRNLVPVFAGLLAVGAVAVGLILL